MTLKLPFKIYLTEEELHSLKELVKNYGYYGNGSISHFLTDKILKEEFIFLDSNTKKLIKALNLKTTSKKGYPVIFSLIRRIYGFLYK